MRAAVLFWLIQVAVAIDQLLNALVPGGYADETISSRVFRLDRDKRGRWAPLLRPALDALFRLFGQQNHCYKAYQSELLRLQCPPEERPRSTTASP